AIPANRPQDHLTLKVTPLEIAHQKSRSNSPALFPPSIDFLQQSRRACLRARGAEMRNAVAPSGATDLLHVRVKAVLAGERGRAFFPPQGKKKAVPWAALCSRMRIIGKL
ncbi:MAG: hypothetical protein J0H18_19110, partial [Rhizobiales bacterium]|nr:hypothetical protein [Hyphomicrobiales bacterium]